MASHTLPPSISERMMDDSAFEPQAQTCTTTVERTGEVCGRELPCQYHSD